jgi:3-hydroxybutyrate dehydrogenase
MEFKDKVVVITGGSKGIGKALALAFGKQGAKVAISARGKEELQAVAKEINAAGGQALAIVCDVSDKAQIAKMADEVHEKFGVVDVLVNNAGIAPSNKFLNHPDEMWQQVMDVNLTGPYLVSKAFLPKMVERGQGGRVINMASIASKVPQAYTIAYVTSKHGLLGFTRTLALEMNKYGITVNAICPGYVDTPMVDKGMQLIKEKTGTPVEASRAYIEGQNPQGRMIEVEEVAALGLMLAGKAAKGITGQAINIDGGAVMF